MVFPSNIILKPTYGESEQCFALKGDTGFVQIRLQTAIFPESVTLGDSAIAKVLFSSQLAVSRIAKFN